VSVLTIDRIRMALSDACYDPTAVRVLDDGHFEYDPFRLSPEVAWKARNLAAARPVCLGCFRHIGVIGRRGGLEPAMRVRDACAADRLNIEDCGVGREAG
jgi:hypothetical protein